MKKQVVASIAIPIASVVVALIGKFESIKFPTIAGSPLLFIGVICAVIIGLIWLTRLIPVKRTVSWKDHPIFRSFGYWYHYIDNAFILEDGGKQELFRDLLKNNCVILEQILLNNMPNIVQATNGIELGDRFLDSFYQSVRAFKRYYTNGTYSENDQRTLGIVMEKFLLWQSERNDMIVKEITNICNDEGYGTNGFKIILVLQLIQILLASTMLDAAKTIRYLNGKLIGLSFRGITIKE